MRKDFSYYPGCVLRGTGAEYAESLEAVFKHLGYTLEELPDWTCCGATSGRAVAPRAALALAMITLAQASVTGKPLVAPCAVCYHNLRLARLAAEKGDPELVEAAMPASGDALAAVEVLHPLEVLTSAEALEEVRSKVKDPLAGFKVVSYYGCLLSRPAGAAGFDDPENPTRMDRLVEALGAEAVDWSWKVECCGGNLALSAVKLVIDLVSRLLSAAQDAGANAICVACPFCHGNIDTRQFEVSKKLRRKVEVPVFYFSELMAIAYDLPKAEKWLKKHLTTPFPLVDAVIAED